MLLDITPPTLNRLFVFGELEFEDGRDYNLSAKVVSVASGSHIGSMV